MNNQPKKTKKVIATLSLTKEAQDIMFDFGYASARTQGEFISQLIVDHHARRTSKPTPAQIAIVLRELVEKLEKS